MGGSARDTDFGIVSTQRVLKALKQNDIALKVNISREEMRAEE